MDDTQTANQTKYATIPEQFIERVMLKAEFRVRLHRLKEDNTAMLKVYSFSDSATHEYAIRSMYATESD